MTDSALASPLLAAQDRIELELRRLVELPVPYRLGRNDDPADRLARLVAGELELLRAGVDCLELMVIAYAIIGRQVGDLEAWAFPVPIGYPYPEPLPSGAWIPEDQVDEWARHWRPITRPRLGDAVVFGEDHVGVILGRQPRLEVIHCHRSHGTALHPLERLRRWASGTYRLAAHEDAAA